LRLSFLPRRSAAAEEQTLCLSFLLRRSAAAEGQTFRLLHAEDW
jgi:hypothetical protein